VAKLKYLGVRVMSHNCATEEVLTCPEAIKVGTPTTAVESFQPVTG